MTLATPYLAPIFPNYSIAPGIPSDQEKHDIPDPHMWSSSWNRFSNLVRCRPKETETSTVSLTCFNSLIPTRLCSSSSFKTGDFWRNRHELNSPAVVIYHTPPHPPAITFL
ncbi:hypothetical protein AVEN_248480-1 [Araneus ventricosus]|uniref:Uncharacterized protein n=1 Tax=Araneus ventricosus TaxID=182803 RepID=A0A4Y2R1H5_ARAVE|nr:hypothetical protein AVEN_248480-1 [Araneus ventricosus]